MRRQIDQLDGVRALAVLAVMGFHDLKVPAGYLGVDVFFVLSGMLITSILLGERDRYGRNDLPGFYRRRMRRLYPALAALLIVCSPFGNQLSQDGSWNQWWDSVFVSATYTANIAILVDGTQWLGALGPLWSVAVEMQFYLLWPPLLVWLLARGLPRRALIGGTAVVALACLSLFWLGPTGRDPGLAVAPSYFQPWTRFGELLAGCVVAMLLHGRRGEDGVRDRRVELALEAGALAGLALIFVAAWKVFWHWGATVPIPLVAIGAALVLARLVTSDRTPLSLLLRIPPLPWIGRISYPLYLWQYVVLTFTVREGYTQAKQQWWFWGGTFVMAILSTYLVERRFWKPRGARRPAASDADRQPLGARDRPAA
jgi:peptidoglycan/LPS O-acetylase OafA/YrhL